MSNNVPFTLPYSCFKCEKSMRQVFNDMIAKAIQPNEGASFNSTGNYGSTVFDPNSWSDRHRIHIQICDDCLNDHEDKIIYSNSWQDYIPFSLWRLRNEFG